MMKLEILSPCEMFISLLSLQSVFRLRECPETLPEKTSIFVDSETNDLSLVPTTRSGKENDSLISGTELLNSEISLDSNDVAELYLKYLHAVITR